MFEQEKNSLLLKVKVIAPSSTTVIIGEENGELKIKVAAILEKNKANETLIRYLAKNFSIAKSDITIVQGEHSRHKVLQFYRISKEQAEKTLLEILHKKK